MYYYEFLNFFAKVCSSNYFALKVRKQDMDFYRNFRYYSLLLLILLWKHTNADWKIGRYVCLDIKKYAEGFTLWQLLHCRENIVFCRFGHIYQRNLKLHFLCSGISVFQQKQLSVNDAENLYFAYHFSLQKSPIFWLSWITWITSCIFWIFEDQ